MRSHLTKRLTALVMAFLMVFQYDAYGCLLTTIRRTELKEV